MGVSEILASVDREIALLKQARALLSGAAVAPKKKPGRPRKTAVAPSAAEKPTKRTAKKRKKRNLSPEGRKRIVDAVKRRWERQRKAAKSK